MRVALLSRAGTRQCSNRRLIEAAQERGHEIDKVPTLQCNIATAKPSVRLLVGGPPLVVKLLEGTQGKGIVRAEKVVAAMMRTAKEGEFRSNLHRGGTASLVRLTPSERSTVVRAAKKMGLNVAGMIIEFLAKHARPNRTRTRGRG